MGADGGVLIGGEPDLLDPLRKEPVFRRSHQTPAETETLEARLHEHGEDGALAAPRIGEGRRHAAHQRQPAAQIAIRHLGSDAGLGDAARRHLGDREMILVDAGADDRDRRQVGRFNRPYINLLVLFVHGAMVAGHHLDVQRCGTV